MTKKQPQPRFAALDVGSLTVRLAVAERVPEAGMRMVLQRRSVTGLGQGLTAAGDLAPESMARTLEALKKFQQAMTAQKVEAYRAVGTQALRQAGNRDDFLRQVRDDLGLTVEVLAPEEEARLTLLGVLSALNPAFAAAPILVVDMGGGSSEFALLSPGQAPFFASLPLGVLTLSQAHPLQDPPSLEEVTALRKDINDRLTAFHQETLRPQIQGMPRLVGTAGAITTLAAMQLKLKPYDPATINNTIVTRAQVAALAESMSRLPEAERARLPGMEPAKAGVMVAGGLIVLSLMQVLRQDLLVVIDAGLLEGVLQGLARKFSVSGIAGKR